MNQDTTKNSRKFRKLEDLNLIDNFLFQQMLSQEEDGEEFARILLSTILGQRIRKVKIIPQKNILGIVILPYDPFGKNRMVYTIQNCCVEDTSIPYDDGARKIFLYTKGTDGNPSQSLKDMLKYIEKSTDDNVTNKDIASIQQLVNKVKYKKEVSINYMKSWEIEEMARNEGMERINQLTILLSNAGRTADIIKAAHDKTYQQQLLEEFDL